MIINKIEKYISEISGGVDFLEIQREIKDILDELVDSDEFKLSYSLDTGIIGRISTRGYKMDMGTSYITIPYELNKYYELEQFYKSLLSSGEFRFILTNIKLIVHDPRYKHYRRNCDSDGRCWGNNPPDDNLEKLLLKTLDHIKDIFGCEYSATFSDNFSHTEFPGGELMLRFIFDIGRKIKKFEHFHESLNHIPLEEYVEEISDIFQEYVDEWGLRKVDMEKLTDFPDENVYNITIIS